MRYGMTIDLKRCSGCKTCSVVCKVANNLPNDIIWNRVMTEGGNVPDCAAGDSQAESHLQHWPVACQHCDNPACVKVCPVAATWKDEETGIVMQDYDRCIGCRMCMGACPYTGVRSFNWDEPAHYADFAIGDAEASTHQKHTVEKCILCAHRVAKGEQPACVNDCIGRARKFGDFDDPESEVSKLIASREYVQLLPEKGTKPSVYYLV